MLKWVKEKGVGGFRFPLCGIISFQGKKNVAYCQGNNFCAKGHQLIVAQCSHVD